MYRAQQILNLIKQLFNTKGRAYRIPSRQNYTGEILVTEDGSEYITDEDGNLIVTEDFAYGSGGQFETLMKSFGGDGGNRLGTMERTQSDAYSILQHILPLPNNEYFTDGTHDPKDNDCDDWEGKWGLTQWGITSIITPTRAQRMALILSKWQYPGTVAPRLTTQYMQTVLQAAGFNVYVYDNIWNPGGVTKTPFEVFGYTYYVAMSGAVQSGQTQSGQTGTGTGVTKIANFIDEASDDLFVIDPSLRGIFYISGNPIATPAMVPLIQKGQFRQLILQLKPAHMAGVMQIKYV